MYNYCRKEVKEKMCGNNCSTQNYRHVLRVDYRLHCHVKVQS